MWAGRPLGLRRTPPGLPAWEQPGPRHGLPRAVYGDLTSRGRPAEGPIRDARGCEEAGESRRCP